MVNSTKYKVSEVAKDLNVPAKDIIDLLGKFSAEQKKTMTALTTEELDMVFEHYTQASALPTFETYFVAGDREKNEREAVKKKAAEEAAKAAEAARLEEARKAEEAKKAEQEKLAQAAAQVQKPTPFGGNRPQAGQQPFGRPQQGQPAGTQQTGQPFNRPQQNQPFNRPQQQGQPFNRPQQGQFNRPQQGQFNRPQQGQFNGSQQGQFNGSQQGQPFSRPQQSGFQNRQQQSAQSGTMPSSRPQQQAPQYRPAQQNANQRPMQQPRPDNRPKQPLPPGYKPFEKQQHENKQPANQRHDKTVRVVDTRTSSVDLAKYDERLDELVPQSVKDFGANKQKLKKGANRFQPAAPKRETEAEKLKRLELEKARKAPIKITIPDEIVVSELAMRLKKTSGEVMKKLMLMGAGVTSLNSVIDFDTAAIIAEEFGAKYEREIVVTIEEQLLDDSTDSAEDLKPRSPIVVVMGHVDHGKTSLLDAIRNTNVTAGEAGGITQHIGAYKVQINGRDITFIDTPGHAAFTAMRARGANVTDIAILVVAADDGIMPQTVEAINHAKAAGVSIIVAINKMDKPTANPDRVKQDLTQYELVPEEWGGQTICVPVSAVTKQGISELLEMVLLTADVLELKANPDRAAKGTVIEAKLDKGRGPVATVLVQNGTLKAGDVLIAGSAVGRIRAMSDDRGRKLASAGPSIPVEIIGLADVPEAGDVFYAVDNEKMARELAEQRRHTEREAVTKSNYAVSLDALFTQIQEGNIKELALIVKADVQGTAEAVTASLEKLSNDEVKVKVIHCGVGAITDSDIMLASASHAIIIGFNVRPDAAITENAKNSGVDIRTYRIIYECIEEMEAAMKGMLAPKFKETVIGHAEVRQTYKISSVGTIAGCYVKDGKITRASNVRVLRDSVVVSDSKLESLKRFKDDAKEVLSGFECGIGVERFNDIKEGDIIEAYIIEEYRE